MEIQRYSVNQEHIGTILSWIPKEIAIPEIQRPFVWDSTKVRNLIDSLYQGYPIGYIILWKNPSAKIKEGKSSDGKKILIDGQQRITSLMTSLLGHEIIDSDYKRQTIRIAFNPITEKFEVQNPAILKDISWIPDIGPIVRGDVRLIETIKNYCEKNPNADRNKIEDSIQNLKELVKKQIGIIELAHDLPIEVITEIFVRINSEGVKLNQADFAMSKIASNDKFGGSLLRKCIDYSCRLMRYPEFFNKIREIDQEFYQSEFYNKLTWLKNENDDLYDPDYNDMLRVAFTSEFNRGKLADLVSLISGRNFEKRVYEEKIAKESFETLKKGIFNFINETNFKRFIMIIKSAGFISSDLIRSQNALNFAYIVYLKLKSAGYNPAEIETYVRKWFVLSILTERYSGSPESQFDSDIRNINSKRFNEFLRETEQAELSEAYWNVALVQNLESTSSSSPYFNVYLASQVKENNKGFLSKDISVKELIENKGDIHHIFPKEYLKTNKKKRGEYNQVANYVYTQSEINISIGKKSPKQYFKEILEQCETGKLKYGAIINMSELKNNLEANCIPEAIFDLEIDNYEQFLIERRILIAKKIKRYYKSLGSDNEPETEKTLITPENPFTNKLIFLNTLRKCEGFIYWVDKYFSTKGLELLYEALDKSIKDIKIITSIEKSNDNFRSVFKDFKEEMSNKGIACELKVIIDSKTKSSIHDRFIISKYEAYNIPSPDVMARGQLSEISKSNNRANLLDQFNSLWVNSKDIIHDWNEIKAKTDKTVIASA